MPSPLFKILPNNPLAKPLRLAERDGFAKGLVGNILKSGLGRGQCRTYFNYLYTLSRALLLLIPTPTV